MRSKIDALESFGEAQKFGETLSGQVAAAAVEQWRKVCEKSEEHCIKALQPLIENAMQLSFTVDKDDFSEIPESHRFAIVRHSSLYDRLKCAFFEGSISSVILGKGYDLLTPLMFPPAVPYVFAATCGTILWRIVKGWTNVGKKQLAATKLDLVKHLSVVMQDIRHHFLQAKELLSDNPVDHYFDLLLNTTKGRINTFAKEKYEEALAEFNRLIEQAKLDDQQRATQARLVKQQLTEWEAIAAEIKSIFARLEQLNQAFAPSIPLAE